MGCVHRLGPAGRQEAAGRVPGQPDELKRFRAKACPGLDPGRAPVGAKKPRQTKLEPAVCSWTNLRRLRTGRARKCPPVRLCGLVICLKPSLKREPPPHPAARVNASS